MVTATTTLTSSGVTAGTSSTSSSVNNAASEDRFLKLLVAQISNQDPMNPMDNAQMTSQMAQISTVSSIEKVNQSLAGLAGQLASMQTLQAGSLVGRDVLVQGNQLAVTNGRAIGAMDLDLPADKVMVDILSPGGQVISSFNLGPKDAGRHSFEWDASDLASTQGHTFRITPSKGDTVLTHRAMVQDKVVSVGADNGTMHVQLQNLGNVAYDTVKAIF